MLQLRLSVATLLLLALFLVSTGAVVAMGGGSGGDRGRPDRGEVTFLNRAGKTITLSVPGHVADHLPGDGDPGDPGREG